MQPSVSTEVCVIAQLGGPRIRCDADTPSTLELIFNQQAHLASNPRYQPSHLARGWQSELTKCEMFQYYYSMHCNMIIKAIHDSSVQGFWSEILTNE